MPTAVKKKPPRELESTEELVARMTPEKRAKYEKFIKWQKGKKGLVDTTALIRELRGG